MRFAVAGVNGRAAAERAASTCHHQRPSEVIRGHQRSSEVIRGHQRSSEVIRGHQRPSEVIRGHQRSSEVIRCHQMPSDAIRGHQRSSERGKHLPRRAPMTTLEPRHVRSEARRGREGEPFVTVPFVTVRRACSRIGRYRYESRGNGRRRGGRPVGVVETKLIPSRRRGGQPVGVVETKLIPSRPADCEHPRTYLMREAISMPSSS